MRVRLILMSCAVLAGCAPEQQFLVHKEGSSPQSRQRVVLDCSVYAMQQVPRAMATQVTPGYSSPGTMYCNTVGTMTSCNRIGGVNIAPSAVTYDANQNLRDQVTDQCLRDKGYNLYPRPVCVTEKDKRAAQAMMQGPQPPASQIPCVL